MAYNYIYQDLMNKSGTFISLAVYYILVYFGVHYLVANGLGFVISVMSAFYWNDKYVFMDKTETSTIKAFLRFSLLMEGASVYLQF